MNNWVDNARMSVINRRMFTIALKSFFGELCILHTLTSMKFSVVGESGGNLLGTPLLGHWEEIKFNSGLQTLICW